MEKLKNKNEVARLLKVSVPTLNSFLTEEKGFIIKGLVDIEKLVEYINKESSLRLSKRS